MRRYALYRVPVLVFNVSVKLHSQTLRLSKHNLFVNRGFVCSYLNLFISKLLNSNLSSINVLLTKDDPVLLYTHEVVPIKTVFK